jgi:hypothetical protein
MTAGVPIIHGADEGGFEPLGPRRFATTATPVDALVDGAR